MAKKDDLFKTVEKKTTVGSELDVSFPFEIITQREEQKAQVKIKLNPVEGSLLFNGEVDILVNGNKTMSITLLFDGEVDILVNGNKTMSITLNEPYPLWELKERVIDDIIDLLSGLYDEGLLYF